jgi:hypothetical protein
MLGRIVTVGWGIVIAYVALVAVVPRALPFRLLLGSLIVPSMFLLAALTMTFVIVSIYRAGMQKKIGTGRNK